MGINERGIIMKAILMSIRPEWVAKILNGIKTLEIRKKFPKDYVGWVYIYCTKGKPLVKCSDGKWYVKDKDFKYDMTFSYSAGFNGKVVARFWCDKVEEIEPSTTDNFVKDSCLTIQELENYLWSNILFGYAIHITKLEIFDKPKELSEFKRYINDSDCKKCAYGSRCPLYPCDKIPLTRAPQSWCYIEI